MSFPPKKLRGYVAVGSKVSLQPSAFTLNLSVGWPHIFIPPRSSHDAPLVVYQCAQGSLHFATQHLRRLDEFSHKKYCWEKIRGVWLGLRAKMTFGFRKWLVTLGEQAWTPPLLAFLTFFFSTSCFVICSKSSKTDDQCFNSLYNWLYNSPPPRNKFGHPSRNVFDVKSTETAAEPDVHFYN